MTVKDRTFEFQSIAQTLSKTAHASPLRTAALSTAPSPFGVSKNTTQHSRFAIAAAQIGRGIFETSSKLSKLARLAKKKSLFDDPAVEIQELTFIIKKDIESLNKQIDVLTSFVDNSNKQTESHSKNVVGALKSKLADTTKEFRDVLEIRTENLKEQQRSRMEFTGSTSANFSRPVLRPEMAEGGNNDVAIAIPQQTMAIQFTHQNRVEAVQNIERTITELGGIFQQLAVLVAEQGEMLQRIDDNVQASVLNVSGAQDELLKFLSKMSSNRALLIKIFLVLIVFLVIFMVFFV